jgi:hypothetical protein
VLNEAPELERKLFFHWQPRLTLPHIALMLRDLDL